GQRQEVRVSSHPREERIRSMRGPGRSLLTRANWEFAETEYRIPQPQSPALPEQFRKAVALESSRCHSTRVRWSRPSFFVACLSRDNADDKKDRLRHQTNTTLEPWNRRRSAARASKWARSVWPPATVCRLPQ